MKNHIFMCQYIIKQQQMVSTLIVTEFNMNWQCHTCACETTC